MSRYWVSISGGGTRNFLILHQNSRLSLSRKKPLPKPLSIYISLGDRAVCKVLIALEGQQGSLDATLTA